MSKMTLLRVIFLCVLIFSFSTEVFSAGAIQARRQAAQRQQQMQAMMLRKSMASKSSQNMQGDIIRRSERPIEEVGYEVVVDKIVKLREIWKGLETSSEAWILIIDSEPKRVTVENYIQIYAKKGIIIRRNPQYYVDIIDDMVKTNVSMLKNPFSSVLRLVAIIEYDFDNGENPDILVKQLLGEEGHLRNKERLGL